MEDLFTGVGLPLTFAMPVTGTVCINRAPVFADRITSLAEQDVRVYRALLRFSKYGAWSGVVQVGVTVMAAVAIDAGAIGPHSFGASLVKEEVQILEKEAAKRGGDTVPNGTAPGLGGVPAGWPGSQSAVEPA